MTPNASGESSGGANNDFPKFSSGDSAGKVLSATYQNKLIAGVERANRMTFGPGSDVIQFGPFSLKKRRRAKSSAGIYIVRLSGVDCDDGTADGTIVRAPCGESVGDIVDVEDALGCFLTGPAELLDDKLAIVTQMGADPDNEYSSGCPYVIIGMCCSDFSC